LWRVSAVCRRFIADRMRAPTGHHYVIRTSQGKKIIYFVVKNLDVGKIDTNPSKTGEFLGMFSGQVCGNVRV